MSRTSLPALVVFASVLLLGTPARGQSAEEIEKLIANLEEEDAGVPGGSAAALARIGSPAVPALIAALSDEDPNVRGGAAFSLSQMAAASCQGQIEAALAVPALTIALSDEEKVVRYQVTVALGLLGPHASPAVPALIVALSDEDSIVRGRAAWALGRIEPRPASVIPALIEALSDQDLIVSSGAAEALSGIGFPAIPDLVAALTEDDEGVRDLAADALAKIGTDLKAHGTVLWWVVPRVYWRELVGLLVLMLAWFALMARFPRHRPDATPKHLALMALTAVAPVALACSAVHYAITREWAQGFLPDAVTVVPFPVAAVLSTALVCTLPAVWVCQRKGCDGAKLERHE